MKRALFTLVALFLSFAQAEETVYIFRSGPVAVDPYASLKAAHKAGEVIQHQANPLRDWLDVAEPKWTSPVHHYRVKPAPLVVTPAPELKPVQLPMTYTPAPASKPKADPMVQALQKSHERQEAIRQREALERIADEIELQNRLLFQFQANPTPQR